MSAYFRGLLTQIGSRLGRRTTVVIDPDRLPAMMQMIAATRGDEIGCDECFEHLGHFAELTLAGRSAAEILPLVQHHLDQCRDCREEYEALLAALQAIDAGAAASV